VLLQQAWDLKFRLDIPGLPGIGYEIDFDSPAEPSLSA
jgi:hypothetical protein